MANITTIPAPIKGWNTTDSIAQIPADMAFVLDNLIPSTASVVGRQGFSVHATGVGSGNVDFLIELKAEAVNKFIAASSGSIFDITSAGTATLLTSGFSSDAWMGTCFNGSVGMVNGVDAPQTYNGTAVAAMTVSGPSDVTKLFVIESFKNRTYFGVAGSQDFWYSALNALGGVLTQFPLSRVGNFGGNLIGIKTLTKDGGDGQEDNILFFMSTGEVIAYSGTDPTTDFSLIGIFRSGRPVDRRAIIKTGPDVITVTDQGYIAMSSLLPLSYGKNDGGINQYIKGAASSSVRSFGTLSGWQTCLSGINNILIINIPQTNNTFVQHVLNANTMAWCRFTGINSRYWCEFGSDLYFGGINGTVYKYGGIYTDNSASINYIYQSGYVPISNGIGRISGFRPRVRFDGALSMTVKHSFDFKIFSKPYTVNYSISGSDWGAAWGGPWSSSGVINGFLNFNDIGYNSSVYLMFSVGAALDFYETKFIVSNGNRV